MEQAAGDNVSEPNRDGNVFHLDLVGCIDRSMRKTGVFIFGREDLEPDADVVALVAEVRRLQGVVQKQADLIVSGLIAEVSTEVALKQRKLASEHMTEAATLRSQQAATMLAYQSCERRMWEHQAHSTAFRRALDSLLRTCRDGAANGFHAEAFATAMDDAAKALGKISP